MAWFDLGRPRDPSWMGKPPQMLAQDVPVWHKWLEEHEGDIDLVWYNVALTLQDPPPGYPENIVQGWMYSVAKRIDALIKWKNGKITIAEVTRKAGLRAIGQMLTYLYLWQKLRPLKGPHEGRIICEFADDDVKAVADAEHILIDEVEEVGE